MNKITIFSILLLFSVKLLAQTELPSATVSFSTFTDDDFLTAPFVSFDGNYLIFVVKKDDVNKFYESTFINNQWSEPVELTDISNYLGTNTYINSPVYNYDATKIYFEADTTGNKDIFVSTRTATGWTKPELLPAPINTNADEAEPSIAPNDNTIYFVRFDDPKEPENGTIYFSRKNIKHQWDTVKQIISPITTGFERTPRILIDNKTLIFASKRDKAKEYTLYYAKNLYSDIWFLPKPIGIYSKEDNLYPSFNYKTNEIYLSSVKKDKEAQILVTNLQTQYRPDKMKLLTGKITDSLNNPVSGTIDLLNPYSMVSFGKYTNKPDGTYSLYIRQNSKFLIDYSGKNLSHIFKNYDKSNDLNDETKIDAVLFDSVSLLLKIYDKDIYEPIDANISIKSKNNNSNIDFRKKQLSKGRFMLTIPIGEKYSIELSNPYIETYYLEFDLSGQVIYKDYVKNVEIVSQKTSYTFKIIDKDDGSQVPCQVILTNLSTNEKIVTTATTDANGNATIYVRKGDYYDVTINPQGYAFYTTQISVTDNSSKVFDVELQPLKQDATIKLNNITFESNSADLNVNSYQELDKVVNLLKDNPEIKVEISAHTDDIGSNSYNLLLSEKRAKSVVTYLTNNEIDVNRLIYKGYGEEQPLVPNNSSDNRALNRRVELKIIEVY